MIFVSGSNEKFPPITILKGKDTKYGHIHNTMMVSMMAFCFQTSMPQNKNMDHHSKNELEAIQRPRILGKSNEWLC
jgi:hypothetical protein